METINLKPITMESVEIENKAIIKKMLDTLNKHDIF